MRRVLILLGSLAVLGAPAWPEAALHQGAKRATAVESSRADAANRFAGTWKLIAMERLGSEGKLLPPAAPPAFGSPNPIGFVVYDAAGYMGLTIMQSGRPKFAGAQATADEAKAAFLGYISYCGTFSVDDASGVVTHHIQTSLNPNDTSTDERSSFQFAGTRLVLKPPRGADGVQTQLTWERMPDLTVLTPMHRRLIGMWKQVGTERRTFDGTLFRTEPPRVGLLSFTAAGHMSVYVMDPARKKFAGADPTPEEARQALTTYGSYFGPYEISEKERYEVTRQIGSITPGQVGQLALRRLEFVGDNRVILKPPPALMDGKLVQGYVNWERVTPPLKSTQ